MITNENNSSQKLGTIKNDEDSVSDINKNIDLETYSFDDAKKKLRLVLSTVDIQYVPWCKEAESKPMVKFIIWKIRLFFQDINYKNGIFKYS